MNPGCCDKNLPYFGITLPPAPPPPPPPLAVIFGNVVTTPHELFYIRFSLVYKSWAMQVDMFCCIFYLQISRSKRHLDKASIIRFWEILDKYVRTQRN